jgi:hypothetical protein
MIEIELEYEKMEMTTVAMTHWREDISKNQEINYKEMKEDVQQNISWEW